MANCYSWSQAWNTETETVKLAKPLIRGTVEEDATAVSALTFLADAKYVGRLVSVERASGIAKFVADLDAAGMVSFETSDLYMIAENLYEGNDFFVGYVIKDKVDLKHLELRTVKDDLMAQYVATKTGWAGRRN